MTARDICKRNLDIEFASDRLIGLGSTFGNGQSDTHTHTRTHARTHARTTQHHTPIFSNALLQVRVLKNRNS